MRYNQLGKTGLFVSELCLGAMTFGGKGFWEATGKARYVGFSNLPAWLASKAITFAEQNGLARFQSAQVYYSIAGRDIEREIAPLCQSEGVAILPWSPLAGGLLSGKFDPDKKGPSDARRASFDFPP